MYSNSNSKRMRSIPMVGEDRISNLPDEILCRIHSYLPSKLAASTTILSKRWKPLWFSVLTLNFENLTFTQINSAMFSRDFTTSPILSFRLKRRECVDCHNSLQCRDSYAFAFSINLFISCVSPRVENLDLDLSDPICHMDLPSNVLNCRSLVVLKLKKVTVFDLSQVDFPRLKTLYLDRVCFQRYQDVIKFLYGCPILEDLQTKVLTVIDFNYNTLVSMEKFEAIPNLIKAKVSDRFIPIDLVREAKSLQANMTIRSFPLVHFPMFHNLTHMELNHTTYSSYKMKWNWLIQVLEHCPKLQNLIIHEDFVDGYWISNKSWKDPHVVPECLSSQLRTCSLRSCSDMDFDQLKFAEYILQHSKVLETMIIKIDPSLDINEIHFMIVKLSSCRKGSATCKLLLW